MKKQHLFFSMVISSVILLTACSESKEFYLEENKELLNEELGQWSIVDTKEIRNGFENPYYVWTLHYPNHVGEQEEIIISSKNAYGLRTGFDEHLTDRFHEQHEGQLPLDTFNISIQSIQQTVTHDENEYLRKYKGMYSFHKELDWQEILNAHHYIRIEQKHGTHATNAEIAEMKKQLEGFGNVEFIYLIDNRKYKVLRMMGEEIKEQQMSSSFGDYRSHFLKNYFDHE